MKEQSVWELKRLEEEGKRRKLCSLRATEGLPWWSRAKTLCPQCRGGGSVLIRELHPTCCNWELACLGWRSCMPQQRPTVLRCLVLQLSVGAGKLINEMKTNYWDCFHLNVLQKMRGSTAILFVSWSQEILLAEWRNEKRRQRREWRKNMNSFSIRWPCGQPELNPSREQQSHLATRTMFIHQLPQSEIKGHSKRSLDSLACLTHCTGGQNRVLQPEGALRQWNVDAGNLKSQVSLCRHVRDKAVWMEETIATALVCLFEHREKVMEILNRHLCLFSAVFQNLE